MKVALVHDYLREYGGAERVLEDLHQIFPEAPVYTAYLNTQGLGKAWERMKDWDIRTSWIQKLPLANKLISPLRILAVKAFESFDLSEYEVVISSCNIYFSKAVRTNKNQLHISYIHTPPRYLYGYATSFNYKKNPLIRIIAELINHYLRIRDFEISQQPDILVANSQAVQQRISKFYRRDSIVIYPPVNVERFKLNRGAGEGNYFLSLSRLWKGKGVDIIIKACTELKFPLKVAGSGPELENLKKIAGKNVEFLGQVKEEDLPILYSGANALVLCAEDEDFGITPVESMASGTPVVALRRGGYLETVVEGKTGVFFDEPTVESLTAALKDFDYTNFKAEDCIKQAEKFSTEQFNKQLLHLIDNNYKKD